jgi:hypothetical protein
MLLLAQRISDGVRRFLNQRDDLVLVLEAADSDMPAGLKIIEAVDAELAHVWSWVFAQSFADPASYVDALIEDIEHKRAAISASLEREGKPALPPQTASLRDRNCDPADRLRAAVLHVRGMVPRLSGGVTLFGLMPLTIGDPAAYGGLVQRLVHHQLPFPWCVGVRFIVREDVARPALAGLASAQRARVLRVDFSPEALAAAAAREAADGGLPQEQRAAAATVAAGIHQAHGRATEAEAHYEAALQHYGETGNAPMAAVAANGIAACRQAQGDVVGAERIMLAALEASRPRSSRGCRTGRAR